MGRNFGRNAIIDKLLAGFVPRMKYKMLARSKKLDFYESKSSLYFLRRIHEELWELNEAVIQGQTAEEIALECADVANVAMMMADRILEEQL